MKNLKRTLFPNRATAVIAGLLAITGAMAIARLTGLAPVSANTAIAVYLAIALAGAATATTAVRSQRRKLRRSPAPMPNAQSPNPMNVYAGSLLTTLAIQQIAESHTPEELWNTLDDPALPPQEAALFAPSLEQAIADAVSAHRMPSSLNEYIMAELEGLARDISVRVPADQRAALAQAARQRIPG